MSMFPNSEALQTHGRWCHLPKHHDINHFLSLHQPSCGLQEGQLYNPPSRNKTSDVMNPSFLPYQIKEKHHFGSGFERCGHTSIGYPACKKPCAIAQGGDIPQLSTDLEKGNIPFQTDLFDSEEQWTGLGQNAFEGSLHAPELESRYNDFLTKPENHGLEQQIGDFLVVNNCADVQLSAEVNADLKDNGKKTFVSIHGNTVAAKHVNAAIDKKEMRARRNRESARRSRMKSKEHFQRMEQTFVLMRRENRALVALMEKLSTNYVSRFPHLRGKLQSLFGTGQ